MDEKVNNANETFCLDKLPPEIVLMIVERMTPSTLLNCMLINTTWKERVEYVVQKHDLWEQLLDAAVIGKADDFKDKSKDSVDYRQAFYNNILWNNLENAKISMEHILESNFIRRIRVYRENIIVIYPYCVKYYNVNDYSVVKTVAISCRDFIENDFMFVIAPNSRDGQIILNIWKKQYPEDYVMNCKSMCFTKNVMCYKIHNNLCYMVTSNNQMYVIGLHCDNWVKLLFKDVGIQPHRVVFLNVYEKDAYVMYQCGSLWKVTLKIQSTFTKCSSVLMPRRTETPIYLKMFHKLGCVFGVSASEKFECKREYDELNPANSTYSYRCPNLSCVRVHGDILILGYFDGVVEFLRPRDNKKEKPFHGINLKNYKKDMPDPKVISIDVLEDVGSHHVYVATCIQIFHFHITYSDLSDSSAWDKYVTFVEGGGRIL